MNYPWLQEPWQRLCDALAVDRLPHAILLAGTEGIGKSNFATSLAEKVLCRAEPAQQPCGHCRSCELLASGSHPDLLVVQPEEKSKVIKVDQIRALGSFIANKSHIDNGYKVVILKPAEAMNINAANALLKNLEEPAGRTLLILVSNQSSGVMPTLRSRCQLLNMIKPSQAQALEWLSDSLDSTDRAIELLSLSGGAPLAALALLNGGALEKRQVLLSDLSLLLQGQDNALAVAARWQKGQELVEVIDCLLMWLPVWSAGLSGREVLGLGDVSRWLNVGHLKPLLSFYAEVQQLKKQLRSGANPNKQLALETLLLQWARLLSVAAR